MISKSAVKDFENRERVSFSWMKKVSRKVVDEEVSDYTLAEGYRFKTKPYLHQLVCWYIGVCEKSFIYLLDMGGGKTKVVLDIFTYFMKTRNYQKMLVLVPNLINIEGWAEEVETHTDLTVMMLDGNTEQRAEALKDMDHDIYVINYQGILHLVCDKKRKQGKKKEELQINKKRLDTLSSNFQMLVLDEIHNVKNKDTITFRVCDRIRKSCSSVFGLTGTPTGRNPEDFWSQFYLIDDGYTLGETLTLYRQSLFIESRGWGGWVEWNFNKRKKGKLHRWIQNKSIRYSDKEMSELPKEHRQIIRIKMNEEQQGWYDTFRSGLLERARKKINIKAQDSYYIRLRQISSGFLDWKDEDTKEKLNITFENNGKMDALDSIITNLPEGHKIIVFIEFNHSGEMICDYLNKNKIKHARIFGGKSNSLDESRKFKNNKDCRVLVANTRAAGQGGNFQVANYCLFFESPSSPIVRKQAERRMSGARQKEYKHVHIYDLVASKTEDKVQEYLKEGKDLFQAIVDGKEKDI